MSQRVMLGYFDREEDVLAATKAARSAGLKILDVYTPYAVHGLDRAMGLAPSRLPLVCLLLGLFGAGFKVWFEFWTTASAWPINVGGKPWNSLPAFIPITFEVMVLFAGVSTFLAFLIVTRLRPGRVPVMPHVGVTDDQFVVVVEQTDSVFDASRVGRLFADCGAVRSEERVQSEARS
ncbi:MAG: DUF3341 domain-containing protein [Candidatus Binatia bacterium]